MADHKPTQEQLDAFLGEGWEKHLHRDEVASLRAMSPLQAYYAIQVSALEIRRAVRMVKIGEIKRDWGKPSGH